MNPTKIFFTDLDGTLLTDQKTITDENFKCLRTWIEKGHKLVLCTGRAISSALAQAENLQLTMPGCYIAAYNGALIYDIYNKEVLHRVTLPVDYATYLIEEANKAQLHVQSYDDLNFLCEQDDAEAAFYSKKNGMTPRIITDLAHNLPQAPAKLLVIDLYSKQKLIAFQEQIRAWAEGKIDSYYSCDEFLELVPPAVNKGNAVKILCEHLGIPLENSVSAGDAENDISMLKVTHDSIVMKNADPDLFQYASYITTADNNNSGVAEALWPLM